MCYHTTHPTPPRPNASRTPHGAGAPAARRSGAPAAARCRPLPGSARLHAPPASASIRPCPSTRAAAYARTRPLPVSARRQPPPASGLARLRATLASARRRGPPPLLSSSSLSPFSRFAGLCLRCSPLPAVGLGADGVDGVQWIRGFATRSSARRRVASSALAADDLSSSRTSMVVLVCSCPWRKEGEGVWLLVAAAPVSTGTRYGCTEARRPDRTHVLY
ncbi:uncharacterized protein [Triticum aestivum]|uniref:uncharacterized protein n=1 Tax=Triticum aestivum TaxID=4565 RepID=UPI001D026167|nr:uncharacterized protein LOC123133701 [Triticum aestivum]